MKRSIALLISLVAALLLLAQPARPVLSDKSPVSGGPVMTLFAGGPPPDRTATPRPWPTQDAISARQKEKPERNEPIWLMYWHYLLFR